MNKKYTVGEDGNVIVITTEGETIEKGIYTKNTDEILSLENAAESINTTINIFKNRLEEHRTNKKIKKQLMIIIPVPLILFVIFEALLGSLSIAGTVGLICMPAYLLAEIINLISYLKSNKKEQIYNKKIIEGTQRVNKINKRIDTLSQDKTQVERNSNVMFTEIKSIYDFNFDPTDYFIERYQIDKRSKEMSKGHKKVKKIAKPDNSMYTM